MGAGASRATNFLAEKPETRLTLAEMQHAAKEQLISSWWLQNDRLKVLFSVLDSDKNGHLDAVECSRAISELAHLGDHYFGGHVDIETARQIDQFKKALGSVPSASAAALVAAVPHDVRALELSALSSARSRLESRAALVRKALADLDANVECNKVGN